MTRLRTDLAYGTITDNPLTAGATTINSADFTLLPTVTGTDDTLITLDPIALYGRPEIVRVTAHSAAGTSVTVARGQLGSTARSHTSGVQWVLSAYTVDFVMQATSTTRPSVGLYEGLMIFETDTKRLARWTGSAWTSVAKPSLSDVAWQLYS